MIAVITYNAPHRKTQDLCFRLKLNGIKDVCIYATPWEERESFKPLFPHRPPALQFSPSDLAKALDYDYEEIYGVDDIDCAEKILIGGAGVLPKMDNIINSHPGYLPWGRGLDALKWSIWNGWPIGVTTYLIGDECDTGVLIDQRYTPLKPNDSFQDLAQRHYELEIDMLVDSVFRKPQRVLLGTERSEAHRRMPHDIELAMMRKWNSR